MSKKAKAAKVTATDADYRALAEFRYHIRNYIDFSDKAAKAAGIEPKQHQLLLAIRGLSDDGAPPVGALAEQLRLRHHSAVELINRAEGKQLVERTRVGNQVFVRLTKKGERYLARAVEKRLRELRVAGPALVKALQQLIKSNNLK